MSLYSELKRRNVFRTATLYLVTGWIVLQAAEILFEAFELPAEWLKLVMALLALGFPLVLVFSWIYEITPEGLRREVEPDALVEHSPASDRRANALIVVMLLLAIGLVVVDQLVEEVSPLVLVGVVVLLALAGVLLVRFVSGAGATADSGAATDPPADAPSAVTRPSSSAVTPVPASEAEQPTKSIAVLPFLNMSSDPEQEYFSDGLAEEVLNLLARVESLHVSARTSSFSFKGKDVTIGEIGRVLGVGHVLEGSVRKSGDRIRITAQLTRVLDGFQMWSERWDRQLEDVFAIQEEIAQEVIANLRVALLGEAPRSPVTDPDAHTLFLQARHLGRQGSAKLMQQADRLYRHALDIDPDYTAAWAGLASNLINLSDSSLIARSAARDEARDASRRALALDPRNTSALSTLAWIAAFFDGNYREAAGLCQRAIAIDRRDPRSLNAAANILLHLGRVEEALTIARHLVEIDPVNPTPINNLSFCLRIRGHVDEARAAAERALDLSPDMVPARINLALTDYTEGDYEGYLAQMRGVVDRTGSESLWLFAQAAAAARLGRNEEADAALETLKRDHADGAPIWIGMAHAIRGERDDAFHWLERAAETSGRGALKRLRIDERFANLRDDPRWQALLAKAGLSDAEVAAIDLHVDLQ